MRYIQRQSKHARTVHWFHTIACLSLFITGLFLYVPAFAGGLDVGVLQAGRLIHRIAAVIFIGVPLIGTLVNPKAVAHKFKEYFQAWTPEDKEFMKKFLPYMFAPKKVHMPKQDRYKSGQKVADLAAIVFSMLIAISGAFMWIGVSPTLNVEFSASLMRFMYFMHDGSMIALGVLLLAHIFVGAGIFQPYRGTLRLMFGDGKISEEEARFHWGFWAEDELKSGKNVTEE
ncbi:MAG: cytochrome b/b6 domain-containing protein [Actinomycetota bacterium]|jgi:formate dehydrogenase subunit gamma|nr:cytochrome b/b6 domain-containing protein [Actinomycetota bacterium]